MKNKLVKKLWSKKLVCTMVLAERAPWCRWTWWSTTRHSWYWNRWYNLMHSQTLSIFIHNCFVFVQVKFIFSTSYDFWLVIIFLINLATDSKPNIVQFCFIFSCMLINQWDRSDFNPWLTCVTCLNSTKISPEEDTSVYRKR